jgi:hypothetical protein
MLFMNELSKSHLVIDNETAAGQTTMRQDNSIQALHGKFFCDIYPINFDLTLAFVRISATLSSVFWSKSL